METLKGIFQCPQKLTNVIQTSQNSPWLSLRSLNKWYGVFAPQYYKFSQNMQRLALLGVLLEYTAQPEKKSKQGGKETLEESTARHSSPKAWVIAVIPVPDAFAPLPTQGELGMNIDAKWGLPSCMRRLSSQTTSLQILNQAEVGNTASADHLLQMAAMPLEHKNTALGIPFSRPVAYHFDGAEALQQSLFSLFALLITGESPWSLRLLYAVSKARFTVGSTVRSISCKDLPLPYNERNRCRD